MSANAPGATAAAAANTSESPVGTTQQPVIETPGDVEFQRRINSNIQAMMQMMDRFSTRLDDNREEQGAIQAAARSSQEATQEILHDRAEGDP
jgi:hypothetical protein